MQQNFNNVINKKVEKHWKILLDQVMLGEVVPIIGSDLQTDCDGIPVEKVIANILAKKCDINDDFDNLIQLTNNWEFRTRYTNYFGTPDLYEIIAELVADNKDLFKPSAALKKLVSSRCFPFVITTAFHPMVENAMREVYGNDVRVLSFDDNADENDDIKPSDISKPVVYHIFGKCESDKRFVVGDWDMLSFSRSWLRENDSNDKRKPFHLSSMLSKKYLLVLGCEYKDWLFKFFWCAMRDSYAGIKLNGESIGTYANKESDKNIIDFLNNSSVFTNISDISGVIDKLCSDINEKKEQNADENKFKNPKPSDVFISYSRADSDVVENLYDKLTKKGVNAWYDKRNLNNGDDFMAKISEAIDGSKLFVPVVTMKMKDQVEDEHYYREEWLIAAKRKRHIGNIGYIRPICEENLNMKDYVLDIPEEISKLDAPFFNRENLDLCLNEFVDKIVKQLKLK